MTREELMGSIEAWIRTGYGLEIPIPEVAVTIVQSIENNAGIPITDILEGRSVVVSEREAAYLRENAAAVSLYQPSSLAAAKETP